LLLSARGAVYDQTDLLARFAVIKYDKISTQFVYSARQWSNTASSHICQLLHQGLFNTKTKVICRLWIFIRRTAGSTVLAHSDVWCFVV